MIIDGGICENVVSTYMVEKLGMKTEDHHEPYQLTWLKRGNTVKAVNVVLCSFLLEMIEFNDFINEKRLVEILIGGREFTRVSDDDRKLSDHCPIMLKDVDLDYGPKPFRVFNVWLDEPDFQHIVEEAWKKDARSLQPDCIFQDRLKNVKASLRVWTKKRDLSDNERKAWLEARKGWEDKERVVCNMLRQKVELNGTQKDTMEISRGCNASFVTIIPKVADPIGLGDILPISLIGCYYKIIAKMLAERIKHVVEIVVGETKNAFIKGRSNECEMEDMARWMGCDIEEFPFTYMGLPIGKNMRQVDRWVDDRRLCDRFPRLYHLDRQKEVSAMERGAWVDNRDQWRWSLVEDGEFMVKELSKLIEEKIIISDVGGQETL
uniref:Transposon TX1 putative 149 kDa protein n=1 Tax=Tanacetum cinerariifolium TaxID=118510 RepID=A0A699GH32_TANCI|nr:transposon TX1 putative 149 kDa protein [Tanacetum cinerariifolium]